MEWTDEGIVLGGRRHGESSAIVELLTREHGRHLGLVRGGAGKRMRPLLQPGNSVTTVWRARLDEHLGYYAIEGTRLRAATLLASAHATYGVTHLASLARLLPERDPHEDIFEMLDRTLDDFDDVGGAAAHLIRFELAMLAELGFGLPNAGTHTPRPTHGPGAQAIFRHKHLWLCALHAPGTADVPIRILPDSAEKFNASPWENDSCRRKSRPKSTR